MTGSSITVNAYGLADNVGPHGRVIDAEDRLPQHSWAAEPEKRDSLPHELRESQSEPCGSNPSQQTKALPALPTKPAARSESQVEPTLGRDYDAEPKFHVLDQMVVDEWPMHFESAARPRPRIECSGYDEQGFPRVLRSNPNLRKSYEEAELHCNANPLIDHAAPSAYLEYGRLRSSASGQKGSVTRREPPQWTSKAYTRPIQARRSDFEPYHKLPQLSMRSSHGLRTTTSKRQKSKERILETARGAKTLPFIEESYRISTGCIQETEDLSSMFAAYEAETQSTPLGELTDNRRTKRSSQIETGTHTVVDATPVHVRKVPPPRVMTVKAAKNGEVLVRSLSKALPLGHTTRAGRISPAPVQPVKQPFGWPRRIDESFTDPAEEHSKRFRKKRKVSNLRRKALKQERESKRLSGQRAEDAIAAAAVKNDNLVDIEPPRPLSITLLDLQSQPPSSAQPPSPVDLLDSPIRENVRKSVLAPASKVQCFIQIWEAKCKEDST